MIFDIVNYSRPCAGHLACPTTKALCMCALRNTSKLAQPFRGWHWLVCVRRFVMERHALSALALTTDSSILTAVGN